MSSIPSSSTAPAVMHEISAALRRGDAPAAEQMIAAHAPPDSALIAAADIAIRARRWEESAWLLERIVGGDQAAQIKRCLSRNMASLQLHRPAVYELLVSLPKNDTCAMGASATGHPTIICRRADGQNVALSPGNQPLAALANTMAQIKPVMDAGQALALCGIGDGYLLHQLAQKPPTLFMDTQQSIFVLEPNAHVALTALMIHDYTGANGPIEQPRFQWFVGKSWAMDLQEVLRDDLFLPAPHVSLMLGLDHAEIQAQVTAMLRDLGVRDKKSEKLLRDYYDTLPASELAEVFGENPPRRPRVLLMTTRFSTVLQYATRDAAIGFQQAGCETRVMIEPTPHHRMLMIAIRSVLAEFKPDMVFQIDHQRQEHGELFPTKLPFVCWIQDHMTHLMTRECGAKLGPTDFVLTDAGPLYVHNFSYPKRQTISLAKLTAEPSLLPRPTEIGEDVVFISNASGDAMALLETAQKKLAGLNISPEIGRVCVQLMIDLYAAGDSLPTYRDICNFAKVVLRETNQQLDDAQFLELTAILTHPIGDSLYRQQALRWAVEATKSLGLSLALYGNGWEKHPEFSQFARGPVAPGRAFHELTRRSAINLQIAPYICLHQRLLDGICSGAFFLVRKHVSDTAPQEMLDLLEACGGPQVLSLEDARNRMPLDQRERFESLVKDCIRSLCSTGHEDPIEMVRAWQEARLIMPSQGVLPHLEKVSFDDVASLRQRIERFVADPDLREQISADQRNSIVNRLTYGASMEKILRQIGHLLETQTSRPTVASRNLGFAA